MAEAFQLVGRWMERARAWGWGGWGYRLGFLAVFFTIAGYAGIKGLELRRWAYDFTVPLRFVPDVSNNFKYGVLGVTQGYWNVYQNVDVKHEVDQNFELNYSPLRLLVFTEWVRTLQHQGLVPAEKLNTRGWRENYPLNAPLLNFNTTLEALAALGLFFLVRLWVARSARARLWRYQPTRLHAWLVRRWPRLDLERDEAPPELAGRPTRPFIGWIPGLIGALIVWFNPAMIISGHGWPSSDLWVLPFFIWGVLLASMDWWLLSGAVIATGAMFKGQQLFIAPIFLLWPLCVGSPRWVLRCLCAFGAAALIWTFDGYFLPKALIPGVSDLLLVVMALCLLGWIAVMVMTGQWQWVLRWLGGFALAGALIASGWMLSHQVDHQVVRVTNWPAVCWVIGVALALVLASLGRWAWQFLHRRGLRPRLMRALLLAWALVIAVLLLWPLARSGYWTHGWIGLIAAPAVVALAMWLRPRNRIALAALTIGAALFLCIPLFQGDSDWWKLGFMYGTVKHHYMTVGPANNLAALLDARYDIRNIHQIVATIEPKTFFAWPAEATPVQIKYLLFTLFILTIPFAAAGIALQWRQRDRRFLLAVATPWLLFYALNVQIHDRYLLFGSGVGAAAAGVSVGMTLLDILLILITWMQTTHVMMMANGYRWWQWGRDFSPDFARNLHRFFENTHPDLSWAVLLAVAVFFYLSVTRSPQARRRAARFRPPAIEPDPPEPPPIAANGLLPPAGAL